MEPGLELSVDVIVRCPTCMALPQLDKLNHARRSGAGVYACPTCGRVNPVTLWCIIQGEFVARNTRPI